MHPPHQVRIRIPLDQPAGRLEVAPSRLAEGVTAMATVCWTLSRVFTAST